MIDENNIPSIQPDFERIKKQDNKGLEYWTSRELCTALGYGTYQKFNRTLNKAIATKHPFFFGDIVISDLSGKLEYSIKYTPMNGGQSGYGKSK